MKALFRPINKDNINKSTDNKQEEKELYNRYHNVEACTRYPEDDIYELYYQEYLEQCKLEALIE